MTKGINKSNSQKGFTLIEVILSIALLGIISIAALTIFTSGLVSISNSGKKSISNYTAQSQIESDIIDLENLPGIELDISLTFSGKSYIVSGRKIDVPYTNISISKKLTTFTTK